MKMTNFLKIFSHFQPNWAKWLLENLHFHVWFIFFELKETESNEPSVNMINFLNIFSHFQRNL